MSFMDYFLSIATQFGLSQTSVLLAGIGLGTLVLFYGVVSVFYGEDPSSRRLRSAALHGEAGGRLSLSKDGKRREPIKGIVPTNEEEYNRAKHKLRAAGFRGANAVLHFYMIRTTMGIVLPLIVAAAWIAATTIPEIAPFTLALPRITQSQLLLIIAVLIVGGFYGPSVVVNSRAKERRLRITEGFPNALDLLQISVEAGLGFDAAMNRVAAELHRSNPEIADEFSVAQQEIAAGRDRDRALLAMAERTGVTEVTSFVTVMLQSMEFGTSVSSALATYAQDMRTRRELLAIEKANKLPVSMSATLVLFMLPALLMLVMSPVVINFLKVAPFGR
jgi:tight adherence protein C